MTLNERPESAIAGSNLASTIRFMRERHKLRRLEDGPAGGTPILQGAELMGHALDAPIEQGVAVRQSEGFFARTDGVSITVREAVASNNEAG